MNRRHFLQAPMAVAASSLLAKAAWAATEQLHDRYFTGYQAAIARDPRYAALKGVSQDLSTAQCKVVGKVPAQLRGTLYRNGPALMERAQTRYQHWFDGDGMVHAWNITDSGVSHAGKFVRTPKFKEESAEGKFLYNTFGTSFPNARPIKMPDAANVANTNVVPHADRLFALWEGGSAFELNPQTLDTIGAVDWGQGTKSVPFSAHPKIDTNGVLWNFGFVGTSLVVYRISAQGKLENAGIVRNVPMGMVHDFLITQQHLLFVIPPTRMDAAAAQSGAFIDAFIPTGGALQVLLVRKDDFTKVQRFELPAGFVFHFGNAYEDAQGNVVFDYVHHTGGEVMTKYMRQMMRGDENLRNEMSAYTAVVRLNPAKGTYDIQRIAGQMEMPRVDPRVVGLPYRKLLQIGQRDGVHSVAFSSSIVRMTDLQTGKQDAFDYGTDYVVEEHILVPHPQARADASKEGQGYVLGLTFDIKRRASTLNILQAETLAAGPVAQIQVPYAIPIGFHGNFVQA